MKNIQTTIVLLAVFLLSLFSCSSSVDDNKAPVTEATEQQPETSIQLPVFNITDASGKIMNLTSLKGKKVFVNLWATWCPPCREEIPSIEALANKVNKEHAVFIMLSLDKNFDVAKRFAIKENLMAINTTSTHRAYGLNAQT